MIFKNQHCVLFLEFMHAACVNKVKNKVSYNPTLQISIERSGCTLQNFLSTDTTCVNTHTGLDGTSTEMWFVMWLEGGPSTSHTHRTLHPGSNKSLSDLGQSF